MALKDRIFFVTGATAGIGEFTAEELAKERIEIRCTGGKEPWTGLSITAT